MNAEIRDLGVLDVARMIAALEWFIEDDGDVVDAEEYRKLADELAAADRVLIVPRREIEEVLQ